MTFQSKISRTRKRLSESRGVSTAAVVALFGLTVVLTFGIRAIALSNVYGVIPAEMPVVAAPPLDASFHGFREEPKAELTRHTAAVVLTTEAFFFADLEAFSSNFAELKDKFILPHVEGEPQLIQLIETLGKYVTDREAHDNIPLDKILVFIPAGDIPMPIVIQVLAGLRKSPLFERVVLGTGII